MYTPVVIGETGDLRASVETMLSTDSSAVASRLAELSLAARGLEAIGTFGHEAEFMLVPDPSSPRSERYREVSDDFLYAKVVGETEFTCGVADLRPTEQYGKGRVILPSDNPSAVMRSWNGDGTLSANNDQRGTGIIEVRTSPAEAVEATERYWALINAIGTVAAQYGRMGLLLSTHVNFVADDEIDGDFEDFTCYSGGNLLAAVQHNLNAMNVLQVDAGVDEGTTVLEAFPRTKDATTTVHPQRLEFRHPLVGVVDPRIDMLASLDGLVQQRTGTTPQAASDRLRPCHRLRVDSGSWLPFEQLVSHLTVWDSMAQRLVLPAVLDMGARSEEGEAEVRDLYKDLTGRRGDPFAKNGLVLREFIGDLRLRKGRFSLAPDSRYHERFADTVGQSRIRHDTSQYRVLPHVIDDSPDLHAGRRHNVLRSSIVRRALGEVAATLTPAMESIGLRKELINNNMTVLEDALR